MDEESTEHLEARIAELLREFGFTEYEAYTFVYLVRLGEGTANDVSEMDSVPRTRVYDAVETLHEAGLVDVKYTSPQVYTPVSRETVLRKLEYQRENTLSELAELFDRLEPADDTPEEFGVWTVSNRTAISSRVVEFVEDADEAVVYMTVDELLDDRHLDALSAAADRGVDVRVGGLSEETRSRVCDRLPSADLFETMWGFDDEGAGRVLLTDERTALASVRTDRRDDDPEEVAIWGTGERNSLVVVLRTIFP